MKLNKKQKNFLELCENLHYSNTNDINCIKSLIVYLYFNYDEIDDEHKKDIFKEILNDLDEIKSFSSMPYLNYEDTLKKGK